MEIYPWQDEAWQRVRQLCANDRLPHALLITGVKGLGLDSFAQTVAAAILTDSFSEKGAEQSESRDWQLFNSGNHPDFTLVEPEDSGKSITVDQIREVISYLQLTSQYSRRKIVVIYPAESMNHNAANGLLKTLEEPPGDSLILLVAHQAERLPVTIRSRCQQITITYQSSPATERWLQQQFSNADQRDKAMMLTGAPLKAKQVIEQGLLEERVAILEELALLQKSEIEPISVAERWNSIGAGDAINALLGFFQDMAKLKLLSDEALVTNRDIIKNLRQMIKRLDLFSIMASYRLLLELNHKVMSSTSYNTQGLLEEFIVRWQSLSVTDH